MKVRKVQCNPQSRIFCYCDYCKQMNPEVYSYAVVSVPSKFICKPCIRSGVAGKVEDESN